MFSLAITEQAHQLSVETGDPMLIANTLNGLSILNYYLGHNQVSLDYLLEAIAQVHLAGRETTDRSMFWFRLQSFYSNAGNVYQSMGELEKSLEMHLQALRFIDSLVQKAIINPAINAARIRTLNNVGILYWNMKDNNKALRFLNQALTMGREIDDPSNIVFTLNNIGLVYLDQQEYDHAELSFKEALELGKQLNDSLGIAGNYNNLGLIRERTGQLTQALSYYLSSYQLSRRMNYSIGISNTSSNIGRIYSVLDQPDSALHYTLIAIDEARKAGNKTYLLSGLEVLCQVHEKTGRYSEALNSFRKYTEVKDSIFNEEKARQIAEMEARFENEKKEQENQILKQKIELQKRNNLLLIISTSALLILTSLLYNFYRLKNRSLKQKTLLLEQGNRLQELERKRLEDQLFAEQQINILQNEKLDQQNRELATRILHLINKNDVMSRILDELTLYKESGRQEIRECYSRLKHLISESFDSDREWEQFKQHFEKVNPGFFHQLKQSFPDLSQNELKLCAYYRINLSTKEIARLLSITPSAVQKSRYRLRKKMLIPSRIELFEFLSRF